MIEIEYAERVRKFSAGEYKMPAPPVHTLYWTTGDWITYIDNHGVWLFPVH